MGRRSSSGAPEGWPSCHECAQGSEMTLRGLLGQGADVSHGSKTWGKMGEGHEVTLFF